MSEDTAQGEALTGWFRLGCATVLMIGLPPWFAFTAMLVHLAGPEWYLDFGFTGPATFLGLGIVWYVAALKVGFWLVVVGLAGVALIGLAVLVSRRLRAMGVRDRANRYDPVVGDGAVLREDAWSEEPVRADEDESD